MSEKITEKRIREYFQSADQKEKGNYRGIKKGFQFNFIKPEYNVN